MQPEELFGKDETQALANYKKLALIHHPDKGGNQEEMAKINALWEKALRKMELGQYGITSFIISTKRFSIECFDVLFRGDLADIRAATFGEGSNAKDCYVKIPRSVRDNDLIMAEQKSLRTLKDSIYVPNVLGYAKGNIGGSQRNFTVLERYEGFVSLREVKDAYPLGIKPRHMAWIFRKLLAGLDDARKAGLVHGGLTPDNVLIHPEQHGLWIVGWCSSVEDGGIVPIVSPQWSYSTPEILNKQPVSYGTDIYMAARLMVWLLGEQITAPINRFLKGTMLERQKQRPQNAMELLKEFDDLIERMWGERKFIPFSLPKKENV